MKGRLSLLLPLLVLFCIAGGFIAGIADVSYADKYVIVPANTEASYPTAKNFPSFRFYAFIFGFCFGVSSLFNVLLKKPKFNGALYACIIFCLWYAYLIWGFSIAAGRGEIERAAIGKWLFLSTRASFVPLLVASVFAWQFRQRAKRTKEGDLQTIERNQVIELWNANIFLITFNGFVIMMTRPAQAPDALEYLFGTVVGFPIVLLLIMCAFRKYRNPVSVAKVVLWSSLLVSYLVVKDYFAK